MHNSNFRNASGPAGKNNLRNTTLPSALLEDPHPFLLAPDSSGAEDEAARSLILPYLLHADAMAPSEAAQALLMLGEHWLRGGEMVLHAGEGRRRVPLPGYPFQRQPCWVLPRLELPGNTSQAGDAGEEGETDRRLDPGYQLRLYSETDDPSVDV